MENNQYLWCYIFHVCFLCCLAMGSEAKMHIYLMSCRDRFTWPQEPNTNTDTYMWFQRQDGKLSGLFFKSLLKVICCSLSIKKKKKKKTTGHHNFKTKCKNEGICKSGLNKLFILSQKNKHLFLMLLINLKNWAFS